MYKRQTESYEETLDKLQELSDQITWNRQKQNELEVWGDFDLQLISKLQESGHHIHFWVAQQTSYDPTWEETYQAIKIADQGRYIYFVTVPPNETAPTLEGADLQKLPKESLSQLRSQEEQLLERKQLLENRQKSVSYTHLDVYKRQVLDNGVTIKEVAGKAANFDISPEGADYKINVSKEAFTKYFIEFMRPRMREILFTEEEKA